MTIPVNFGTNPYTQAASIEPNLERDIRNLLGSQEGAMNLLNDLISVRPYTESIKNILNKLLKGTYGDFSTDQLAPQLVLASDLRNAGLANFAQNISKGRYDHNGPNYEENIQDLNEFIFSNFGKK